MEVVHQIDKSNGFFSEFFFMLKTYLYAKKLNKPFFLVDTNWMYKFYLGWHDYFTSLHTIPSYNNPFVHIHNVPPGDYTLQEYTDTIHEIFKLRPHLRIRVRNIVSSLPKDFISVFIRRGDKLIQEAPFIPTTEIFAKIPHTSETVFFIQTDDYGVIEEIRQHLSNKLVYTVPETKRGSYHKEWQFKKTNNEIREETEEMLIGLSVCVSAKQCWTDHTSNVGRFLKLYSLDTVHLYTTDKSIDKNAYIRPTHSLFE